MGCIGELQPVICDRISPYGSVIKDPTDSGVFTTLTGHQAEVNCVKFMQNENIIASGDQKGTLQIRTKKTGKVTEHSMGGTHQFSDRSFSEVENCDRPACTPQTHILLGHSWKSYPHWRFRCHSQSLEIHLRC